MDENKFNYYAVANGRKTGIFNTLEECQEQIKDFKCPLFKGFDTLEEAEEFIVKYGTNPKKQSESIEKPPKPEIVKKFNNIELTLPQKEALKLLESELPEDRHIFLTGEAGTGKSYLISYFIERAKENKKEVMLTAPTGAAAFNIGGATLHSAFGLPYSLPLVDSKIESIASKKYEIIEKADILIIDEISMVRNDIFSCIMRIVEKHHPNMKVILVGDFFQLPPIIDEETQNLFGENYSPFAFSSPYWNRFEFNTIRLTNVIRQKSKNFCEALSQLREGDYEGARWIKKYSSKQTVEGGIYLCSKNIDAAEINRIKLEEISAPSQTYIANMKNMLMVDLPCERELILKPQCRVVSLVDDPNGEDYKNGSLGTIIECNEDTVCVEWDSGIRSIVGYHTWAKLNYKVDEGKLVASKIGEMSQIPLKLAYAITIHKSQGQTFEKVNVKPYCFASGQLYVALSRCTNIDNLHIDGRIQKAYLKAAQEVIDFFNLSKQSSTDSSNTTEPENKPEETKEDSVLRPKKSLCIDESTIKDFIAISSKLNASSDTEALRQLINFWNDNH